MAESLDCRYASGMEPAFDHTKYSSIVFIDSMVALQGKPLEALPWAELDAEGPVLILVIPQVNAEIDKRKRDGRLNKRARAFNRLIAPAADNAAPHTIAAGPPAVDIAVARCERINWELFEDLDRDEGDDRVVAQILHALDVPNDRKLLLSHDTNPISIAARHGLRRQRLPDHWLLDPEPSESEKEVQRLKLRVRELEAAQPKIEVSLDFGLAQPQRLFRIEPMPENAEKVIASRVIRQNPNQEDDSPFNFRRDDSYDGRYRDYLTKIVPRYTASVHRFLEVHYAQVPFTFCLKNVGNLQAESLVLRMVGKGGSLHNRFTCYPIFGPPAPKPRTFLDGISFDANSIRPSIVGRHDMQFAIGPDRSPVIETHCADFRHGRAWEFEGVAMIDPHQEGPFVIDVEVTASNMRGIQTKAFYFAFTAEVVKIGDLVDLLEPGYKVPIPLMDRFTAEVTAKNWDWIEVVGVDGLEEQPDDDDEDGDDED